MILEQSSPSPLPKPLKGVEKNPFNDELTSLLALVETKLTPERRKEIIGKIYADFINLAENKGGRLSTGTNDILRSIDSKESVIVRRENPQRVLSALKDAEVISIQNETAVSDKKYANAVLWKKSDGERGLNTAFLEGFGGKGGFVIVMGTKPSLDISIEPINASTSDSRSDRGRICSAEGILHPEDLRFIIMRIPAQFFDEKEMTESELEALEDNENMQIFRTVIFSEGIQTQAIQ